jgi:formylglycine-generating enzyme required for sulfatase activity
MKANRTLLNACACLALTTAAIAAESEVKTDPNRYLVIDMKAKYTVKYLADVPPGGWTDEYKTTKLVLRRIPAGTFTMGSPANELGRDADEAEHTVTLTKDYYVGVFEVTQKQWQQVMGDWAGGFGRNRIPPYRDVLPVEQVSYYQIREKFGKPVVAVVKDAAGADKAVDTARLADDASSELWGQGVTS